jgi:hypothetical protein
MSGDEIDQNTVRDPRLGALIIDSRATRQSGLQVISGVALTVV